MGVLQVLGYCALCIVRYAGGALMDKVLKRMEMGLVSGISCH